MYLIFYFLNITNKKAMNFFFQSQQFLKKYKILIFFLLKKKNSEVCLNFLQYVYLIPQEKQLKSIIFKLFLKYNSNFLKQLLYLYHIKKCKKVSFFLINYLKKTIKYFYLLDCFKHLKKQLLLTKQLFHIQFSIGFNQKNLYLNVPTSKFLVKIIITFLNIYNYNNQIVLKNECNNLVTKKNSSYKNLFIIFQKKKISQHFFSRPVKWLIKYSEPQIYLFFEHLYLKIIRCKLIKKLILQRVLQKSFLLTIKKKGSF